MKIGTFQKEKRPQKYNDSDEESLMEGLEKNLACLEHKMQVKLQTGIKLTPYQARSCLPKQAGSSNLVQGDKVTMKNL